ncbi:hypothetical protein ABZ915_21715 [Streptomyces sp. NPDC046915]|uniref:hypothetical protein n=1 Tax=Streptomyces sp. NPDC046915 TaxID=3155257 RepID=UPI00340B0D8A
MRLFWLVRFAVHINEFGYSKGALVGTLGTVAVLLAALVIWSALRRHTPADMIAAGLTCAVGIGWLALH